MDGCDEGLHNRNMASSLLTYRLYGDDGSLAPAEVMHAELIAERSRLHSWEIKPHRHEALFQCFLIERGRIEAVLDQQAVEGKGPCLLTVMPLAVHGFRWTSDVEGRVFTVEEAHLRQLLAREPAVRDALLRTRLAPLKAGSARELSRLASGLMREHQGHGTGRALAVDAALVQLAVALARGVPAVPAPAPAAGARSLQHVQRFRALVDDQFRTQPALGQFAAQLGITATQLNRACRAVLGHPALAVLHARLALEAQRELAYTTLSIKHIAWRLGFSDAAYFTRFFERETGSTPSAWRGAHAR